MRINFVPFVNSLPKFEEVLHLASTYTRDGDEFIHP